MRSALSFVPSPGGQSAAMLIDAIEVYYVVLPLIYPWRTAYGEDYDIHTVLVRMISGGQEGWGETSPLAAPTYSPEFALAAFLLNAEWFAPRLVGQGLASAHELLRALALYKGNPFAKGGVETAWWMLQAAIEEKPLH